MPLFRAEYHTRTVHSILDQRETAAYRHAAIHAASQAV